MDQRARELLEHGLKDMYDAEQRFSESLVKMARNADDKTLSNGFKRHKDVTDNQVKRLEEAFREMEIRPERETCKGATGLIEEYESFVEEHKDGNGLLDAFSATAGLKVEHYEIASYRTLVDLAQFCGFEGVARLLGQNLAEEEQAAAEMMTNATKLSAKLAGASAAQVARRGVGAAFDEARETTFNAIGRVASVAGRASEQLSDARRSTTRGTTARKKASGTTRRAKSTARKAKSTARRAKSSTTRRAKSTARRATGTATRASASTRRKASTRPARKTASRGTSASRRTSASRSRSTGTRRRTTSRSR